MGALDPAVAAGRAAVRLALADLAPGDRITLGVSGGADSLALAAVTSFVAERAGLDARAIVVDHGLQAASADVAARAADQVRSLGLAAEVVRVEVAGPGGPEAAARRARRAALSADPAAAILLAHTLDDQAETVLLGLGRGSGPRSIRGMRAADGLWRRPFLTLRRADTERICRAHGLDWWSDPHNADPGFRRSRVRTDVLPLLEDVLGGGVAEALARTAAQVRADSDLLDELAAGIDRPDEVAVLEGLHPALRTRVLRRLALDAGAAGSELSAAHVAALERLVTQWHGQRRVELPGGVACSRVGDRLTFASTPVAG